VLLMQVNGLYAVCHRTHIHVTFETMYLALRCRCSFVSALCSPPSNAPCFWRSTLRITAGGRSTLMLPLGGDRRVPLDVLHYAGRKRYLQLATVSKEWHSLYTRLFSARQTAAAAVVATVPLLAWARDSGYGWT
jgi:hypothetical protein